MLLLRCDKKVKNAEELPKSNKVLNAVKETIIKDILPKSDGPSHLATNKPVRRLIALRKIFEKKLANNLELTVCISMSLIHYQLGNC